MNTSIENIGIKKFLPHRTPFLMIDKWLYINEKETVTSFLIPENCIFIKDGKLLECGLVENAAQTCSTIVGKSVIDRYESEDKAKKLIGFISGIKKLEIFSLPEVLATIITKAELISRFDTDAYCICGMKCSSFYNETRLLDCELNLIIQEMEE